MKSAAVAASVIPELLGEKGGGDRRTLKLAGQLAAANKEILSQWRWKVRTRTCGVF